MYAILSIMNVQYLIVKAISLKLHYKREFVADNGIELSQLYSKFSDFSPVIRKKLFLVIVMI